MDTSDEWIYTRTGIKRRHLATDQNTSDLALEVVVNSQLDPADLRLDRCGHHVAWYSNALNRRLSYLTGKQVTLQLGHGSMSGIVQDIDDQGCLLLASDGKILHINSGEVTKVNFAW